MRLTLLLALAKNGVIGRDNDLPWRLPADLRRFKRLTMGHAIVMGRRTWESIGRPLPGRKSVVLSRDPTFQAPGAEVVPSLAEALRRHVGDDEIFIIGGAEVFAEALPRADRLELTRVHADVAGDVEAPDLELDCFELIASKNHRADERHAFPFTFETWQRKAAP